MAFQRGDETAMGHLGALLQAEHQHEIHVVAATVAAMIQAFGGKAR